MPTAELLDRIDPRMRCLQKEGFAGRQRPLREYNGDVYGSLAMDLRRRIGLEHATLDVIVEDGV